MGTNNLVGKVAKDITKSGFPLELHVLDICSKKNMGLYPNFRYLEKGEVREIDLYAFFEEINFSPKEGDNPQFTSTNFIIECKKSVAKPWVFFTPKAFSQHGENFCFIRYTSDFDLHLKQSNRHSLMANIFRNLKENHYNDVKAPMCISYCEAFKKPSAPSDIYDAIDKTLSFLNSEMQYYQKEEEDVGAVSNLFFPIIVLDGELFEACLEDNKIEVKRQKHVQLRTFYSREIYIVDIVKKNYFGKFLDILERDHFKLVQAINKISFSEEYLSRINSAHKQTLEKFRGFPLDLYYSLRSEL